MSSAAGRIPIVVWCGRDWFENTMMLPLKKIAERLDIRVETLERWIRQGRVPVSRKGDRGVFVETELEKWIRRQKKIVKPAAAGRPNTRRTDAPVLVSAIRAGGVHMDVTGEDKTAVLASASAQVPSLDPPGQEALLAQLLAREELTSTGIGQGIAIPHPRNPLEQVVSPAVVTCYLKEAVDFNAIDDQPVSLLFLILSPTVAAHLNLLARLSFCLRNRAFVDFLKTGPGLDALIQRVHEMENQIEKKGF